MNNIDTDYKYYNPKELYDVDFVAQNVILGPDNDVPENDVLENVSSPVSPAIMHLSFEDEVPVAYFPLTPSFYESYDD